MDSFFIVGGLLALAAVCIAGLGLSRRGFPGRGERFVMAGSVVWFVGAVVAAVITAGAEKNTAPQPETAAPSAAPATPATVLRLSADPSGGLHFDKGDLQAPAGPVSIVMTNPAPIQHNISLQGNGQDAHGPTVSNGSPSTVNATLAPGTYTFYCSVPGHREGGMQGTLTVR